MKTHFEYHDFGNTDKALIMTHGLGSSIEDSITIKNSVDYFKTKGINLLAFDAYGHGQSQGEIPDVTNSKVSMQFQELVEFLKKQGINDLYLSANSGLSLSTFLLGENIKDVNGVFLFSPIINWPSFLKRKISGKMIKKCRNNGYIHIPTNNKFDGEMILLNYSFIEDIFSSIKKLPIQMPPIYAFTGGKDHWARTAEVQNFLNSYDSNVMEFQEESHGFSDETTTKIFQIISSTINTKTTN